MQTQAVLQQRTFGAPVTWWPLGKLAGRQTRAAPFATCLQVSVYYVFHSVLYQQMSMQKFLTSSKAVAGPALLRVMPVNF